MDVRDEVMQLVTQAWPFPDEPLPGGADDTQIDGFAERTGVRVPEELRQWLRRCDGADVGYGGVYGIELMEFYQFTVYPEWREKGWIALAGDGCGDTYVLDTSLVVGDTHPVYFIDHETYEGQADYVVASGLWPFLRFLLLSDIRHREAFSRRDEEYEFYWPFDAERVLAEDPALRQYKGTVPLAWEAD